MFVTPHSAVSRTVSTPAQPQILRGQIEYFRGKPVYLVNGINKSRDQPFRALHGAGLCIMNKRKGHFRPTQDFVSEEMVTALLKKTSYDFNELFEVVHARLRARNATGSGKEMLRLRIYEKLHILVAQGLVKKDGKIYTAVRSALQVRMAEMAAAKAQFEQRRGTMLHVE